MVCVFPVISVTTDPPSRISTFSYLASTITLPFKVIIPQYLGICFKGTIGTNRLRYTAIRGGTTTSAIHLLCPISFQPDIIPHVLPRLSCKRIILFLAFSSPVTSSHHSISCQGEALQYEDLHFHSLGYCIQYRSSSNMNPPGSSPVCCP